jgi:hypothetical protein
VGLACCAESCQTQVFRATIRDVTLVQTRNALRGGALILDPGTVSAKSEFQRLRLAQAVTAAQIYLDGSKALELAATLGVTPERAAQMVRLGIRHMRSAGWLRPAAPPATGS